MLFVSNDEDLEWFHKTYSERLAMEFIFQEENLISKEFIECMLERLGKNAEECSYPSAVDQNNIIDWLCEIYSQIPKEDWIVDVFDNFDTSEFNEKTEAGLAAVALLIGVERKIIPNVSNFLIQEWSEEYTCDNLAKRLWQWTVILEILYEFDRRSTLIGNGWFTAWRIHFDLLKICSKLELEEYVPKWGFIHESWDKFVDFADFESLIGPNIGLESERRIREEKTLANIIPMGDLPFKFKQWIKTNQSPLAFNGGYNEGWGNHEAASGTSVRDKLSDAHYSRPLNICPNFGLMHHIRNART